MVDSIVVKTSNDTVYVWDYNAWEQCAFQLDYAIEVIDSVITITQIDTAIDMTTCYGYHNFVVPIVGLSTGNYRIDIYRDCLYQDIRFIKSHRFEYVLSNIITNEINPSKFMLHNAYPNPFNPSSNLSYELPSEGFVSLKIYDSLGKEVVTLVSRNQQKGFYKVNFNPQGLSSSIFYFRLQFKNQFITKKMVFLQ